MSESTVPHPKAKDDDPAKSPETGACHCPEANSDDAGQKYSNKAEAFLDRLPPTTNHHETVAASVESVKFVSTGLENMAEHVRQRRLSSDTAELAEFSQTGSKAMLQSTDDEDENKDSVIQERRRVRREKEVNLVSVIETTVNRDNTVETLVTEPQQLPHTTAKSEEALQGEENPSAQSEENLHGDLSIRKSAEKVQPPSTLKEVYPSIGTKSYEVCPQTLTASKAQVSTLNPPSGFTSARQPVSPCPKRSAHRSLHWKSLIEKGMGIRTTSRKGRKGKAKLVDNVDSNEESIPKIAKINSQSGPEDFHQSKEGSININEFTSTSHSITTSNETQNDGIHGSNQVKFVSLGQDAREAQHSHTEKFHPDDQQSSEYTFKNGFTPAHQRAKVYEPKGENIERERSFPQGTSTHSTNRRGPNTATYKGKKHHIQKPKRIVPGSKSTVSIQKPDNLVKSRDCVVMNTGSEKATGEFSRKPNTTLQPLNQPESIASQIHQSHTNIIGQEDKKAVLKISNSTNQITSNNSDRPAIISMDGLGRTGRSARGRNSARPGITHQTSGEIEQLAYRVEPKVVNRRQRGYQPHQAQSPTSSNPGALDHPVHESYVEKQEVTEDPTTKVATESNFNVMDNATALANQPPKEPEIVMSSFQSEQVNVGTYSSNPSDSRSLNSGGGVRSQFPQGIDIPNRVKRTKKHSSSKNKTLPSMDEEPSILPNGNWDSSDNTTQQIKRSPLGYNIDFRKIPKYRFQGPPSSLSVGTALVNSNASAKINVNNPPHQLAPEKKTAMTPSTSLQKSDHLKSQNPPAKSIGEEGYIPPHLKLDTPKVSNSKALVAVPHVPFLKTLPKHEKVTKDDVTGPRPSNNSSKHISQNSDSAPQNSDSTPQHSVDKGKEKATSNGDNIAVKKAQDVEANPTLSINLQNYNQSMVHQSVVHQSMVLHPLAGRDGKFAPAPVEWACRPSFNPYTRVHVQTINDWTSERVNEAVNNPVALDIHNPEFETGEALAAGDAEFGKPIDSKEHETHLPDDDFTHAKHHETAADAAKKLRFKARQDRLETKAERKAYRNTIRLAEMNYVPPPNPHAPLANIYLRPAEARDLRRITEIYNHYVEHSVVVAERDLMDERQWRARWEDAKDQRHAFIVAVQMSQRGGGYNRRTSDEVLAGFAYADDYGNNLNAYRYTAELQVYVANWIPRSGVGKSLLDRMLAALDPCYICRNGAPFEGGANYIWYEQGGVRLIKKVIISIPYWVKDDSALKWQKEWLTQFEFEQVATMPGVGHKFGKELNVAILMKETGTMVPMGT